MEDYRSVLGIRGMSCWPDADYGEILACAMAAVVFSADYCSTPECASEEVDRFQQVVDEGHLCPVQEHGG